MKKAIKRKWITLIAALLVTVGIIYVYNPITGDSGWPSGLSSHYRDTGLYRINPATILTSLEKGDTDVFLPDPRSVDDRYDGPLLYNESIEWNQSDNLKIVRALNNFVWKDRFDDWNLFIMAFNVDCQDNLNGLPGGAFQYFKTIFEKGKIVYTWRQVEITPEYSFVAWGGNAEFAHLLLGWKSIDLNRLKVMAEDAIRIAEERGGREARLKLQNQCNIHLLLMPEHYRGWKVDYGYSSDFEIFIDPYTGEVIK
jgi:hypothetical protein